MNFALIGCGGHGQKVAKVIEQAKGAELTTVFDTDFSLLRTMDATYKVLADAFPDTPTKIYDAVWICTPNHTHKDIAIKAARAGKHIICEKPMSPHLFDIEKMIKAADENKVGLTVTHTLRYNGEMLKAKELIRKGEIGEVTGVHISVMVDKPRTGWKAELSKAGGGVLMMNAIHMIDLIPFITGLMPTQCSAQVASFEASEVEDVATVLYRLTNGAPCVVEASSIFRSGRHNIPFQIDIRGTKGELFANPHTLAYGDGYVHTYDKDQDSRVTFLEDFVSETEAGGFAPVPPESGFVAVSLVQAAYHAAKVGRVEKIVEVGI